MQFGSGQFLVVVNSQYSLLCSKIYTEVRDMLGGNKRDGAFAQIVPEWGVPVCQERDEFSQRREPLY